MAEIYITTVGGKSALVTVEEVMDGGMVEFHDAISGVFRGSAGINWWRKKSHSVLYKGSLPELPDPTKWILNDKP